MSPSELRQTVAELYRKSIDNKGQYQEESIRAIEEFYHTVESYFTPGDQGKCPVFDVNAQKTVLGQLCVLTKNQYNAMPPAEYAHISELAQVFASLDATKNKTLEDTVSAIEILNVRVQKELNHMSGTSNNRGLITVTMGDNSHVNGFFTPDEQVNPALANDSVRNFFLSKQTLRKKDAEYQAFISAVLTQDGMNNFLRCFRYSAEQEQNKIKPEDFEDAYHLDRMTGFHLIPQDSDGNPVVSDSVKELLCDFLAEMPKKFVLRTIAYGPTLLDTDPDSSLAKRNIAMSRMATLLGTPKAVARSVEVTLDGNGGKVSGVFMEQAEGHDFPKNDAHIPDSPFGKLAKDSMRGAGLKSLADLQILDFLCMNLDRHQNNMLYSFDENGYLTSVMGIDNDMSFGKKELRDDKPVHNGFAFDQLYVISESMRDSVLRLNENMVKAVLNDTGLTEDEIMAVTARLEKLQNRLRDPSCEAMSLRENGKIHIVMDDEWQNITAKELSPPRPQKSSDSDFDDNIFSLAVIIQKYSQRNRYFLQDNGIKDEKPVFANTERIEPFSAEALRQMQEKFAALGRTLEESVSTFHKTHEQFDDLRAKMKNFLELKLPQDGIMSAEMRPVYLNRLEQLRNAAQVYIEYKEPQNSILSTGKNRLAAAKKIRDLTGPHLEEVRTSANDLEERELSKLFFESKQAEHDIDTVLDALVSETEKHEAAVSREELTNQIAVSEGLQNLINGEDLPLSYFAGLAKNDPAKLYDLYSKASQKKPYAPEREDEVKGLKQQFKKNVALIQEIFPDFKITNEQMEKYFSDKRLELHRKAAAYNENIETLQHTEKPREIPASIIRCLYTFCDKSGTPEADEKNRILWENLGAPGIENERLRKQMIADTLNGVRKLDASKFGDKVPFDETAEYIIENLDICERAFEIQNVLGNMEQSMGICIPETRSDDVKNIQDKGQELGRQCLMVRKILASEYFCTVPYEELTLEQVNVLMGDDARKKLQAKGLSFDEAKHFIDFLLDSASSKRPLDFKEPEEYVYTADDFADTVPSLMETKERLAEFYSGFLAASDGKTRIENPLVADMLEHLSTASAELSKVDGSVSVQQTACLKTVFSDLSEAVKRYKPSRDDVKNDPAERKRVELITQIEKLLTPNVTESLLFDKMMGDHNRSFDFENSAEFYSAEENTYRQMKESGLTFTQFKDTAAKLNMPLEEYVRRAAEKSIPWQPTDERSKEIVSAYHAETEEKKYAEIRERFALPNNDFSLVLKATEMTADELDDLPFIKTLETREEKNAALLKFLSDGKKYAGGRCPKEYNDVLVAEELSYADVWTLSIRQGVTIDNYFDRLLGKEELKSGFVYGKESEEIQYRNAMNEINEEIRAKAKNPLESAIADTFIEMKEQSFRLGSRLDMEKSAAKLTALKIFQNHLGLKNGESLENDDERLSKINKFMAGIETHTADVSEDDTFRYLMKTLETDQLADLSRGAVMDGVNKLYSSLVDLRRDDSIHKDFVTRTDNFIKSGNCLRSNQVFFPEKFSQSGNMIETIPNPFGLSTYRSGLLALAMGRMIQKGYEAEDVLDPYKLSSVKKQIGEEVYEMAQHEENREAVIGAMLTGFEKILQFADRQLSALDSLTPAEMVSKCSPLALAASTVTQDYVQDIQKMLKQKEVSEDIRERFNACKRLQKNTAAVFSDVRNACKNIVDMATKPQDENSIVKNLIPIAKLSCLNRSFQHIKPTMKATGQGYAECTVKEYEKDPNSKTTSVFMNIESPNAAFNFVSNEMPEQVKRTLKDDKKSRVKFAEDVFTGNFDKQMKAAVTPEGKIKLRSNYFEQFGPVHKQAKKVPAK